MRPVLGALGYAAANLLHPRMLWLMIWPMLVAAGFRPSQIRCFSHKFGLNTFAVCRAPD